MDNIEFGRAFIEGLYRCALAKVGRKWTHVCFIDDGNKLRVTRVRNSERLRFQPLTGYETAQKLARRFLSARKIKDSTRAARNMCVEVMNS